MVSIQIITLFPELFLAFKENGLMSRAQDEGAVDLQSIFLRDHAINNHGQVDDTPYGGGSGMVMRVDAAKGAIETAKEKDPNAKVVLFSPRGKTLNQNTAKRFARECQNNNSGLILLCPRYEGVDERIIEEYVDEEVSIGDYILMGGEVPAMVFLESVVRLLPGVLGNPESIEHESFENNLLEHPQYTKPREFEGRTVPEVLLKGHHAETDEWRKEQALEVTKQRRPDLLKLPPTPGDELHAAIVHYPVVDKTNRLVTSSITTIDLPDIARSCKTFGIDRFYCIHPTKALRVLADKINEHWISGYGSEYNPKRKEALSCLEIVPDIDDMILDIETRTGKLPKLVVTSARPSEKQISYQEFREEIPHINTPHIIVFGTAWGLADEVMDRADIHLEPISGATDYRHLSVRSAAAITFDRLLGKR